MYKSILEEIVIDYCLKGVHAVICVTTRFHLKYFWNILPIYLSYRRMQQDIRVAPGLIRYAFVLESPVAYYMFSLWESEKALEEFSNTPSHLNAVRCAKQFCGAIWSGYWQFDAISKSADQWTGSAPWPTLTTHPVHPHRLTQTLGKEGD